MSLTLEDFCYIENVILYLDKNKIIEELPTDDNSRRFRVTRPKLTREVLESIRTSCQGEKK